MVAAGPADAEPAAIGDPGHARGQRPARQRPERPWSASPSTSTAGGQGGRDTLAPGTASTALLLLAQLAYAPNAIIWGVAYVLGPGFAFGAGTVVAPTGSALGALPVFPMLAALPSGPGPAWMTVLVLATPYLAGMFAGIVTVRVTPTPVIEAAALWGFAAGAATGALAGLAAAFAGGPLGDGRRATVGPSGWQVGLVAMLQIGVTAALTAAAANWLMLRRTTPRLPGASARPRRHRVPPSRLRQRGSRSA